jgi:dUTP pyrophosphatase
MSEKELLIPKLLVKYHKEICPILEPIEILENGDFVDLRSAEVIIMKAGKQYFINLGVSIKLPEGYWGQFVPRSSAFRNWGIIQTNSFAVIDESYCGENDIWKMPVYATRDTIININDRVCQFRIVKKQPFSIEEVEKLEDNDRGGFGSTGIN